jgi:antagonist of KipI
MKVTVLQPGLLTSVQDLGRWGYQRYGIAVGGALDGVAARVANLLVGNQEGAAVLEMAQIGPELQFDNDALVAWCGADFPVRTGQGGGDRVAKDRPHRIKAGDVLSFGRATGGLRGWLAVAGGFDVPLILGSRSTYRRAGLGGHKGRPLVKGDELSTGQPGHWAGELLKGFRARAQRSAGWSVRPASLGGSTPAGVVRAVRGPEWDWFTADAHQQFFASEWQVTDQADRMGVRLTGPILELDRPGEMISSGVTAGIVQVPGGGAPVVLLASRQSLGGYPRLAAVASADLWQFAQFCPGDRLHFSEITLAAAQELYFARERDLSRARSALASLSA